MISVLRQCFDVVSEGRREKVVSTLRDPNTPLNAGVVLWQRIMY
jgi:hypothetical protein